MQRQVRQGGRCTNEGEQSSGDQGHQPGRRRPPPEQFKRAQQASQLAAVLPNPLRWSAGRPNGYVIRRAAWIRQQMNQLGGSHYLNQLKPQRPDWWPRWL